MDYRITIDRSQYEKLQDYVKVKKDALLKDIFESLCRDEDGKIYYTFVGKVTLCMFLYRLRFSRCRDVHDHLIKVACDHDETFKRYYHRIADEIVRFDLLP